MAALGEALSTSPDTVKGQPLPSLYSRDISSSCVCLSSHSVTVPVMTETFRRKYGNSVGKLGDWIYQRSSTQFIPPRASWTAGISPVSLLQIGTIHPGPWRLSLLSSFPPSLPCLHHARAPLEQCCQTSVSCCCCLWSRLCLPHTEPQEQLTLSPVTFIGCSFFLHPWSLLPLDGLWWHQRSPFPEPGARGQTWGREGSVRNLSPLLLCFQGIVQAAHLFFWDISACSLQRLIFSGWFQKQWEMSMQSQCCKSTLKPSLDLEPGLARSAVKFSKGKGEKAISHHRSSGVFSMGTMMFWLSSKNFSNY